MRKQREILSENIGDKVIVAYRTKGVPLKIVPATADRPWMGAFETAFANRCLPMRIANQAGWFLLNPAPVEIFWNGGRKQHDLKVRTLTNSKVCAALSHFGHGIVTWWLPYLFRTPPGFNMHVRGPVNFCKDGIIPLEGVVETDWSVASFPMSWKVTRVGAPIRFEEGEPICMISPLSRGDIEAFRPEIRDLECNPELERNFWLWSDSRKVFNEGLVHAPRQKWQKHYFLGTHPAEDAERFAAHQVRMKLRRFEDLSSRKATATPSLQCATRESPPEQGGAEPFHYEDDWFEGAEDLRAAFEEFLGAAGTLPGRSRDAWQLRQADQGLMLSADARCLFSPAVLDGLEARLRAWCKARLNVEVASAPPPRVGLYMGSIKPNLSQPPQTNSIRYYLGLTGSERRTLKRGHLILERFERQLQSLKPFGKAGTPLHVSRRLHLAIQHNRLLAVSGSVKAGISATRAGMNPRRAIVVIEGTVILSR